MSLKTHTRGELIKSIRVGRSNLKKKDVQLRTMAERMYLAQARVVEMEAEVERLHLSRIAYENPGIDIDEVKRYREQTKEKGAPQDG
jgi:hypothetical protein